MKIKLIYHTATMLIIGVNGEALQLHAVYKKAYFLLQVTRETISVLQVTLETIKYCKSHACVERAMVHMINHYHHSTKLYLFVAVGIVTRAAHS